MKAKIVQNAEKPVPVEVMAESITAIAQGVKKLMGGPLNRKALVLLIQNVNPGDNLKRGDIENTIDAIQDLERVYLKPKKVQP